MALIRKIGDQLLAALVPHAAAGASGNCSCWTDHACGPGAQRSLYCCHLPNGSWSCTCSC